MRVGNVLIPKCPDTRLQAELSCYPMHAYYRFYELCFVVKHILLLHIDFNKFADDQAHSAELKTDLVKSQNEFRNAGKHTAVSAVISHAYFFYCVMHYSANCKAQSCDRMSVCLSVRSSVMVDRDHIGLKSGS